MFVITDQSQSFIHQGATEAVCRIIEACFLQGIDRVKEEPL